MSEEFKIHNIDPVIPSLRTQTVGSLSQSTNVTTQNHGITIPYELQKEYPDARHVQTLAGYAQDPYVAESIGYYTPTVASLSKSTERGTFYGESRNPLSSFDMRTTGTKFVGLLEDIGQKMKISSMAMIGIFRKGENKERLALTTAMMSGALGTSMYVRNHPMALPVIIAGAVGSYLLWNKGHKQSSTTF